LTQCQGRDKEGLESLVRVRYEVDEDTKVSAMGVSVLPIPEPLHGTVRPSEASRKEEGRLTEKAQGVAESPYYGGGGGGDDDNLSTSSNTRADAGDREGLHPRLATAGRSTTTGPGLYRQQMVADSGTSSGQHLLLPAPARTIMPPTPPQLLGIWQGQPIYAPSSYAHDVTTLQPRYQYYYPQALLLDQLNMNPVLAQQMIPPPPPQAYAPYGMVMAPPPQNLHAAGVLPSTSATTTTPWAPLPSIRSGRQTSTPPPDAKAKR